MTRTEQILAGSSLKPAYEEMRHEIELDERLDFLRTPHDIVAKEAGQVILLGFGFSGWQDGTTEVADNFYAKTDIFDIEPELLKLSRQGKGTGPRMYNTPQAVAGAKENVQHVGLYAFAINPSLILDQRRAIDQRLAGKGLRMAEYAGLVAAGTLLGDTARTIQLVNGKSEGADAVLRYQTPSGSLQRAKRRLPRSRAPEELMVIRRDRAAFQLVGTYSF